jgi:hypothetical protein
MRAKLGGRDEGGDECFMGGVLQSWAHIVQFLITEPGAAK